MNARKPEFRKGQALIAIALLSTLLLVPAFATEGSFPGAMRRQMAGGPEPSCVKGAAAWETEGLTATGARDTSGVAGQRAVIVAALFGVIALAAIAVAVAVVWKSRKGAGSGPVSRPGWKDNGKDGVAEVGALRRTSGPAGYRLTLSDISRPEHRFEVPIDWVVSIGRAQHNTVCIFYDRTVSARHCEIFRVGDGFCIRDLSSKNGTYVNDKRVTDTAVLTSGDTIRVGTSSFRVGIRK